MSFFWSGEKPLCFHSQCSRKNAWLRESFLFTQRLIMQRGLVRLWIYYCSMYVLIIKLESKTVPFIRKILRFSQNEIGALNDITAMVWDCQAVQSYSAGCLVHKYFVSCLPVCVTYKFFVCGIPRQRERKKVWEKCLDRSLCKPESMGRGTSKRNVNKN